MARQGVKLTFKEMTMARQGVKLTFTDGTTDITSVNAKSTEKEIRDYFRVGEMLNVGYCPVNDDILKEIASVELLGPLS